MPPPRNKPPSEEYLEFENTEELFYDQIGGHQKELSQERQESLCLEVLELKNDYFALMLALPQVQEYLLSLCGRSASTKLSAAYNSSRKGWNATLKKEIEESLQNAFSATCDLDRVHWLEKANLHPKVLFSKVMVDMVRAGDGPYFDSLNNILDKLESIRTELLEGVLKLISDICLRRLEDVIDPIISYADLVQEGQIAAWEATLYGYDPSYVRDIAPYPARWSSYVYSKVDKVLAKNIIKNSNTLRLPRTVQDRLSPIRRVMDEHQLVEAADILARLGNKKANYTVKEIEALLRNSELLRIDLEDLDESDPTWNEYLSGSSIEREAEISKINSGVLAMLTDMLTTEEFRILSLSVGMDTGYPPLSPDAVSNTYKKYDGKLLTGDEVKEVIRLAMNKLREDRNATLRELFEASISLED